MAKDDGSVRLDFTERVAWVTVERPPLNRLDAAALAALDRALDEAGQNADAAVLVMSGAGTEAFCGGLELSGRTPDEVAELTRAFHRAVKKLVRLPQAIVAAVDGVASGAGLELALVADVVVASDRSRLGLGHVRQAALGCVAAVTLPTICGRPPASDLVLSGGMIDPARAQNIGLVSRVFPAEEFDESLRALVARLADASASVLRLTAQTMRSRWLSGFDVALDAVERTYLAELTRDPDMAEGLKALAEARKPVWR
ncbi:MAG: enoyl-CoA hydratase/isomerase family protein [Deltaproteobacteria bacterium]|nr:enoyl-CoA hydratase/isomerase family protein [Deltaproteobacteria bacterium]